MNIDSLKEIVKLFQTATDGAITIATWWLVRGFILSAVGYLLGFYVAKKIFECFSELFKRWHLRFKLYKLLEKNNIIRGTDGWEGWEQDDDLMIHNIENALKGKKQKKG